MRYIPITHVKKAAGFFQRPTADLRELCAANGHALNALAAAGLGTVGEVAETLATGQIPGIGDGFSYRFWSWLARELGWLEITFGDGGG
jgi:hypothetical protein